MEGEQMTEYAAGTVAVATVRGVKGVRVMRGAFSWAYQLPNSTGGNWAPDGAVTDIRPLVVLDPAGWPDQWNQPSRAEHALLHWADLADDDGRTAIGTALRYIHSQIKEQTKPARIPEPLGLAAVVVDVNGDKWIRHDSATDCEDGTLCVPWRRSKWGNTARWSDFHAVEVLSEGLT